MENKVKKLVTKKLDIVGIMAAKYNLDPEKFKATIKATIMRPGKDGRQATDEEFMAFLIVANKYDLDPFTNEIYAFPAKKGGIIPVIGIDGYARKVCNRPEFDGMEIAYAENMDTPEGGKKCPEWCEVKLYRKGVERPVIVREYLDEVYASPRGEYKTPGPWQTHTKRMLRHKTIIQAGRVAGFLTGVYDSDEAERILEAELGEPEQDTTKLKPEVAMPQSLSPKAEIPALQDTTKRPGPTASISLETLALMEIGETAECVVAEVSKIITREGIKKNGAKYPVTDYILEFGFGRDLTISAWGTPVRDSKGESLSEGTIRGESIFLEFKDVQVQEFKGERHYSAKEVTIVS